MKVEGTLTFGKTGRRKAIKKPRPPVRGRIPRIAKLMALAIKMQEMVDSGEVDGYSELAELAQVSRARMTQIMNLNLLSPAIQETLLFLPPVESGRDAVTLRSLQAVCLARLIHVSCFSTVSREPVDFVLGVARKQVI